MSVVYKLKPSECGECYCNSEFIGLIAKHLNVHEADLEVKFADSSKQFDEFSLKVDANKISKLPKTLNINDQYTFKITNKLDEVISNIFLAISKDDFFELVSGYEFFI